MENKGTKTYFKGSVKQVSFSNGGSIMKLSLNADQVKQLADDKGWVRINIQERREVDQYGNTHYATLDDWKPSEGYKGGQKNATAQPKAATTNNAPASSGDLPF